MTTALDELERRVGEKWAAAAAARVPQWPDDPFDLSEWTDTTPLPDDVPQFPRERWLTYPNKRATALVLAERMLDFDLDDKQWMQVCFLMQYGGKERLS